MNHDHCRANCGGTTCPARTVHLPLSVASPANDRHPAEAIEGPHKRASLLDRLLWRMRVRRAERMMPKRQT